MASGRTRAVTGPGPGRSVQQWYLRAEHVRRAVVCEAGQPVREADELSHERGPRAFVELGGWRDLLEPTGGHDADPVTEGQCLLLVVGHEQRRGAHHDLDPSDLLPQQAPHPRIQCRQRLVEEQDLGADGEGAREGDALLLPTRKLVWVVRCVTAQSDEVEQLVDASLALRRVDASETQAVGHVVPRGHVREEAVGLEDDAHVPAVGGHAGDVAAVHHHAARIRLVEPGQRSECGGLAAPRRPQERHQLARLDLERQAIQGTHLAIVSMQVDELDSHACPPGFAISLGRQGGHDVSPVASSSAARRPLGAALATARMRTKAKMSAPRATATATKASRLPSRLMTTWTVS